MVRSAFHTSPDRVQETLRMIEVEHLDIRTTTLSLSLLDIKFDDLLLKKLLTIG